ncbi:MlaD family protein [Chondromyces crocatus]|uniref:ABC transporter substrate-binding protein n=1 Tax=Chondromyces crocatus TaxID=52 RepID=A0A0K1EM60_CHOCO|nr:MlaD family protein [Chondromyces crocatus]AKT41703.1 ABC transporter substrate-binding protein [Chondromyces crocatus]
MRRSRELKVGIFVLAGLFFAALVIFLIGDERRLFNPSVEFHSQFADVQGLKAGAPVRMGGIDVGHVSKVGYGTDARDATIYVTLKIVESEAGRIRKDSTVKIATKGLLGDKMIELSKGESAEGLPPGSEIQAEVPKDMLGAVGELAVKAESALGNIERASASLADERLHDDLRAAVASMNRVLGHVAQGEGYANRLLASPDEAERISRAVTSLERAGTELSLTLRDVRAVVARVQSGPGFAHDMIYGAGPQKEIQQFGRAAEEVGLTLRGIRESDSFAHDVLFGGKGDSAEALSNVTAITADLRSITRDVRAGKGTLGALLVDPSIYEDLKVLLGNVQRNDVLRALVRYSIKQDEKAPEPKPAVDASATKE